MNLYFKVTRLHKTISGNKLFFIGRKLKLGEGQIFADFGLAFLFLRLRCGIESGRGTASDCKRGGVGRMYKSGGANCSTARMRAATRERNPAQNLIARLKHAQKAGERPRGDGQASPIGQEERLTLVIIVSGVGSSWMVNRWRDLQTGLDPKSETRNLSARCRERNCK